MVEIARSKDASVEIRDIGCGHTVQHRRVQRDRSRLVERIKGDSQTKEDQRAEDRHPHGGFERTRRIFLSGRRDIALHDILTARVGNERVEEEGNEEDDEGRGTVFDIKIAGQVAEQFGVGDGRLPNGPYSTVDLEKDKGEAKNRTANENDSLDGVGPYHRFDATHNGVDDAKDANDDNTGDHIDRTHLSQRDGRQVEDNGNAPYVKEDEGKTRKDSGGEIEALFQELVGTGDV